MAGGAAAGAAAGAAIGAAVGATIGENAGTGAPRTPKIGLWGPRGVFQRGIYYRERLRAYVCYTGRFVVGRGRGTVV